MSALSQLRVLITHDWLVTWAGAERVLAEILEIVPQAKVVVAVRSPRMARDNAIAARAQETWVGKIPLARIRHRWFVPLHYSAFAALDTRGYDLVISSSHAFSKAVRPHNGVAHVCYCHSPPRYVWDMGPAYRQQSGIASSAALALATPLMRWMDKRSAKGVTRFVSNSRFVAERIRNGYGREATVIHPPVDPKPASPRAREDFLLVLGRLVAYKRVDLAIRAAERLGVRLIVAGDGPERERLARIAGPNTTFRGEVDEQTAGDLMERCRAFVFCAEEDFGIAPVEANFHGAPVIGFARGGLLESMVPGTTALLFERQSVDDVALAIDAARTRSWDEAAIRRNAQRFNRQHFREKFAAVLENAVSAESKSTPA